MLPRMQSALGTALCMAAACVAESEVFEFTPSLIPIASSDNLFPMEKCHGFKLHEASIDQIQKALTDGQLTSVQLVQCYMTRMYQTDQYINSILQVNPDVFAIAAARDEDRKHGKLRSNLHGIPFTVKDNIATDDNMDTTAGSWSLMGAKPPRDAHVVAKLRDAGAVLFGKATLSEWADMRSSNYSEGYSARGGQCRSAYNLTVNPGGSSSGSAVGVGANVIPFSIGTDTDGSVINPASRNSIVGFKPTVGLTSRAGVIPESEHQDSVGAFGKTVRDAVTVLDAMYGPDPHDNYTLAQEGKVAKCGFSKHLSKKDVLQGATFGLPWMSYWRHADDEQLQILLQALNTIKAAGATIINGTEITNYENIVNPDSWNWDWLPANQSEFTVVKVDFYNNIKKYLSEVTNTNIKGLEDIVQYNYDNDGSEGGYPWPRGNPAFYSGQDIFEESLATKGSQDETYFQALHFCQTSSRNGLDDALHHNGQKLDGLLVPPAVGQSYQQSAQAGYPVITIPVGVSSDSGMPFGLAILQTAWAEAELVKYGSAIEDALGGTNLGRFEPKWRGYLERNIPVPF